MAKFQNDIGSPESSALIISPADKAIPVLFFTRLIDLFTHLVTAGPAQRWLHLTVRGWLHRSFSAAIARSLPSDLGYYNRSYQDRFILERDYCCLSGLKLRPLSQLAAIEKRLSRYRAAFKSVQGVRSNRAPANLGAPHSGKHFLVLLDTGDASLGVDAYGYQWQDRCDQWLHALDSFWIRSYDATTHVKQSSKAWMSHVDPE